MTDNQRSDIVEKLINLKISVATAESCTGGRLASEFTRIPGVSGIFGCGVVTYSNAMKEKLLGVSHETLSEFGAVSTQTAREMVSGLKQLSDADICVSVTGIAGPGGGSPQKPVGLVYIGIIAFDKVSILENNFSGTRIEIQNHTIDTIFNFIKNILKER